MGIPVPFGQKERCEIGQRRSCEAWQRSLPPTQCYSVEHIRYPEPTHLWTSHIWRLVPASARAVSLEITPKPELLSPQAFVFPCNSRYILAMLMQLNFSLHYSLCLQHIRNQCRRRRDHLNLDLYLPTHNKNRFGKMGTICSP